MRGRLAASLALWATLSGLSACASLPDQNTHGAAPAPAPAPPSTAGPATPSSGPMGAGPSGHTPSLTPLSKLPGWSEEDHLAALKAFQAGCGVAKAASWRAVCTRARLQVGTDEAAAKAFFEDNFRADLRPATGLLTAYFAPEYPAREAPDEIFSAALRPKPDDLTATDADPADGAGRKSVRPSLDGDHLAQPDRAEIEAQPVVKSLAFMKPEDLFFLQIQGSGVLVFPDGRRVKAIYAADNGRPFVGIARPMTEAGLLPGARTSGDAIRTWLADHRGPEANAVMDKDPRYVFFTLAPDDDKDPEGAAGVALPAGRSLAVDPSYHAYGELYWIDASAPVLTGAAKAYRRLAIALDSGSAIRGDVRADLYLGRGDQAGVEAGHVRHSLVLVRLVPIGAAGETAGARDEKTPRG